MQTYDGKNRADLFSWVVRSVVAPLWAVRERSPYLRYLASLEKSQNRPLDEVKQDQWRRFKKLLVHACRTTDYYAEVMGSYGITPEAIESFEDLTKLPLLTKEDIREHRERMVARDIPRTRLIPKKTSGSTGVSLEFYVDEESLQWKRACAIRYDRWTGWDIGERVAAIWGNPEYKQNLRGYIRNALLERRIYLDTLKMDEDEMHRFTTKIRKKRPTLLFGHAHSLYLFANFLKAKGISDIRPKGIISTAMVLHEFEREEIERVFNCKVTNRYGCEEVSLIACECNAHRGLHMNMDSLLIEILRDGMPAQPGEPGALVVTDLTNYGMPFIRYKIGDVGVVTEKSCSCGCSYPLLSSVEGRIADYVRTPDGHYISGISLTENFAMKLNGVKQLQIIQETIDHLIFKIVRGKDFDQRTLTQLDAIAAERFGPRMRYSLEFVHSIQQESSGKYRFCISKIENPFS